MYVSGWIKSGGRGEGEEGGTIRSSPTKQTIHSLFGCLMSILCHK